MFSKNRYSSGLNFSRRIRPYWKIGLDSLARYTSWFRGSTPYISAHRGKTFVVFLGGEALAHANLVNTVHDLALLNVWASGWCWCMAAVRN